MLLQCPSSNPTMTESGQDATSWASLIITGVCALTAIIAADAVLSIVSPIPPAIMEVDDGIEMLRGSNPETLFLGSSHTRSFVPMRQRLLERTGGDREVALVPVEWGIFSSYRWVLFNRIAPLLDGRPAVRRAVLITTFYDMCDVQHIGNINLPARAWELEHFVSDVARQGLTHFNRNYVQTRWKTLFAGSVLVQNRGHERVSDALREQLRPIDEARRHELWEEHVAWATANMESQYETCWPETERKALDEILDFFIQRGIEPTIVAFPLMPDIISARSRDTTLARYSTYIEALGRRRGVRVVDMTFGAPLKASDFQDDFDHLTAEANPRFSAWVLDARLSFLLTPAPSSGEADR